MWLATSCCAAGGLAIRIRRVDEVYHSFGVFLVWTGSGGACHVKRESGDGMVHRRRDEGRVKFTAGASRSVYPYLVIYRTLPYASCRRQLSSTHHSSAERCCRCRTSNTRLYVAHQLAKGNSAASNPKRTVTRRTCSDRHERVSGSRRHMTPCPTSLQPHHLENGNDRVSDMTMPPALRASGDALVDMMVEDDDESIMMKV